jgi:hypothetical protein
MIFKFSFIIAYNFFKIFLYYKLKNLFIIPLDLSSIYFKSSIIFCFAIFFILPNLNAQKITWDKLKDDNVRHIGAESLEIKIDNATYQFSLTVFSSGNSKNYALLASSIWKMENDGVLMIKLGNQEAVKLVANNVNKSQIDYPKYNPLIGGGYENGTLSTQKVDYYVSLFPLDLDLFEKFEKYGIVKMRIQFVNTYFESSWKKDTLGKFIKKSYDVIENQLNKPITQKNKIDEDFE